MFKYQVQKGNHFEELTNIQHGWDFTVAQLGPSEEESIVDLYQTPRVAYNRFRYGAAYDQRLHAKEGTLSFGLLDPGNPVTWAYDQLIPNDALTVFPNDHDMKASSPVGFCGNGMHFSEGFMASLAEKIYRRPLSALVPAVGIYLPDMIKLGALRAELRKWQQLVEFGADFRQDIIARREESLALAIFDALYDASSSKAQKVSVSDYAVKRALEVIHNNELENILASELCKYAGCSQRTLEKSFLKRFGVTPKKYIKCLRMAQVHQGLRVSDNQGCASIIELAGIHGFWHMGQFAADYRSIYGELPSEALSRR
ncbi:MAG: helix-turn-helix domain-containing protein [Halioglobus sp.]